MLSVSTSANKNANLSISLRHRLPFPCGNLITHPSSSQLLCLDWRFHEGGQVGSVQHNLHASNSFKAPFIISIHKILQGHYCLSLHKDQALADALFLLEQSKHYVRYSQGKQSSVSPWDLIPPSQQCIKRFLPNKHSDSIIQGGKALHLLMHTSSDFILTVFMSMRYYASLIDKETRTQRS